MRATYMYGAGDVRVIDAPEPTIVNPTDAIVRVVRSCICGPDLHPYHSMPATPAGVSMGTSSSVSSRKPPWRHAVCRSSRHGIVEPGRVFDREIAFDDVPDGYRAMDRREALMVIIRP